MWQPSISDPNHWSKSTIVTKHSKLTLKTQFQECPWAHPNARSNPKETSSWSMKPPAKFSSISTYQHNNSFELQKKAKVCNYFTMWSSIWFWYLEIFDLFCINIIMSTIKTRKKNTVWFGEISLVWILCWWLIMTTDCWITYSDKHQTKVKAIKWVQILH